MPLKIASPIPAAIAVGTIFDIATASGIVWLALATALRIEDRQRWAANGAVFGLAIGVVVYVASLLV